jgi:signal transduction histidine kinase/CheY-like chemotaxis protein
MRVPNFPVYVAYGIDRRTIIAAWYRALWMFGAIAAATAAGLMLTSWLALQRARHEARAAQALQETSRDLAEEISRRERAEASLLQAQRLEAVGQLTGGIAHDFNNLLTIILGNLQLAERRNDLGRIRQLHGAIRQAAERGAGLTRQLLAFSRQTLLRPETVRINDVLENARTWLGGAITEAVEINYDLAADLGAVRVDVGELEAAILNIAVNARDAMPTGGRLTMRTRNMELTAREIAERRLSITPGSYVCLSMHDTGTGMSRDVLTRVYEPFFTTKEVDKGTGLGLSRVYGFVQQSGGAIWIESEVDRGTDIYICLPRATGAVASPAQERPAAAKTRGEGTILVVEDSDPLRKISVSLLHDAGYSTVTARNGTEALAMLKAGEPIDLLFSDIVMPRGLSGLQLAREAVVLRPGLKVLLTTGFPYADAGEEFAVLTKPFTEVELTRAVKAAMSVEPGLQRSAGAQPLTAPR